MSGPRPTPYVGVRGTLTADIGDWRTSGEPVVGDDVDISLIVLAGVEMLLVPCTFFFLEARGFFTRVPAGSSCHLSLTP
jgi:hypothetical protein